MRQSVSTGSMMDLTCSLHGHGEPEPIGLEYVAASIAGMGLSYTWRTPKELVIEYCSSDRKLLALFTSVTHDYPQVFQAAKEAKKRGETTVLGGYHACSAQVDPANCPFDYIVIGEGEEIGPSIAKAHFFNDQRDLNSFKSSTFGAIRIVHAPRITDIDALPHPLRDEEKLARYRIYDLMWPPASSQQNAALMLSSRGCANDCDFCASSTVWGHGVRMRSPERIVEELKGLVEKFGTNTVVFIDQSLGQVKQWTLELCGKMRNANLGIHWYHQSNLNIDREVVRAMAEAGCSKIGFGLEGISPRAVSLIKPLNPCDLDSINSLFEYCIRLGLFVKVYLMIGFPWETDEIIAEYFEWLPKIRANQVKISFFTPFPGTRDWTRYRHQLVTQDWADFDTVKMPVVYNPNVSVAKYFEIRKALFKTFYGSSTYADVTRQMIHVYPHYKESYREFANYLIDFDMISEEAPWLEGVRPRQGFRTAKLIGQ